MGPSMINLSTPHPPSLNSQKIWPTTGPHLNNDHPIQNKLITRFLKTQKSQFAQKDLNFVLWSPKDKMSGDDGKSGDHHHHHQEQQYGTFQGGPPVYPPQPPAVGFPQPVPPPGVAASAGHPASAPAYYAHGYQAVPGGKP